MEEEVVLNVRLKIYIKKQQNEICNVGDYIDKVKGMGGEQPKTEFMLNCASPKS